MGKPPVSGALKVLANQISLLQVYQLLSTKTKVHMCNVINFANWITYASFSTTFLMHTSVEGLSGGTQPPVKTRRLPE